MPPDRETIARNVRNARENRGLSQHAVAKKLGFSRTLVAMVELGNRPVTDEELTQFASLYGTTIVDLKGTQVSVDDDPVTAALLTIAPEFLTDEVQRRIHAVLGSLMQASDLARLLERPPRLGPPTLQVLPPRTPFDAIAQGEQMADQERDRLGVRDAPLADIPALLAAQGVRTFAVDLPDRWSGICMQHPSVGSAIMVNGTYEAARRRFFLAHGYAHALVERTGPVKVCKDANSRELIECRAHAFAAAFLLPSSGVQEAVRRLGKGHASRTAYWVFDAAMERSVRAEERAAPGSQAITYADVAGIARRFGAAYKLTVSRLLGLGLISESDSQRLLRPKSVVLASECFAFFGLESARVQAPNGVSELSDLKAEVFDMAIEAYRRGLMTRTDLMTEAISLQIPGLSEGKLLELAEAAR